MAGVVERIREQGGNGRRARIVEVLVEAFDDLMRADADAFRRKFRKMAAAPFAFYRGSACLFYADMADEDDPWANDETSRVWIQGDLHAENFGSYMDSSGTLVFDVNDFDEAYLGCFTWDLKRLAASVALLAWSKAISDDDIATLIGTYLRAYVKQVRQYAERPGDELVRLQLDSTEGILHDVLLRARLKTRIDLLDELTVVEDYDRRFRHGPGVRVLEDAERETAVSAFESYLDTIPQSKRFGSITYRVKDIVGRTGFGIGSAGLPAYNILVEGRTQALENDVVLSMKQGNVAAPSRIVPEQRIRDYFTDEGHRTAVSQRALQAHADPWLGHTEIDGTGFVVSELSPYVDDLDWSELTEPAEMRPVLDYLGRATAKMHCVSDSDSEQTLVDFQSEAAIAEVIGDREDEFVRELTEFGMAYAEQSREDHRLFVDAFRGGEIPAVRPAAKG
ncbi:DUF2252 domain-containing protein [Amycolatopsis regifaucium]|uniref:DUF2252 domain-containing protein n=1 Tax=Amycolatopsis regifaucium TaxID=546365 RepID=A0A154MP40_9PSEU|nr:DUF2252 domain-containing protein [Amycolatopsis regifaucium]KZB86078.1 hypothetical protein AVL48_28235 [Amycolatopsis regifaucium]OKA04970.1 hypothetical protein ATP06_0228310 [Amycolatopsis regifaucium]SFH77042.1 Uncharacterized conserved protein, DUF2252 family [Amycolatopsis regifaucium]